MLKQVTTLKTPIIVPDLVKSFIKYWQKTYNALPKKETVITMVAQFCHESGSGSHCYNYNLCNIKARDNANAVVKYCVLNGVWELDSSGNKIILPPTNPGSWFRAFDSLDEGAEFYCNFLRNSSRYQLAWQQVEAGNPTQFVHELHQSGYFTDHESSYTAGVMSFYNKYMNDAAVSALFASAQPQVTPTSNTAVIVNNNTAPQTAGAIKTIINVFSNFFGKKS